MIYTITGCYVILPTSHSHLHQLPTLHHTLFQLSLSSHPFFPIFCDSIKRQVDQTTLHPITLRPNIAKVVAILSPICVQMSFLKKSSSVTKTEKVNRASDGASKALQTDDEYPNWDRDILKCRDWTEREREREREREMNISPILSVLI